MYIAESSRIVSTAADGSLAVGFWSDGGDQRAGWAAHVGIQSRETSTNSGSLPLRHSAVYGAKLGNGFVTFTVPEMGAGSALDLSLHTLNGVRIWSHTMLSANAGERRIALPQSLGKGLYILRMSAGTWNEVASIVVR